MESKTRRYCSAKLRLHLESLSRIIVSRISLLLQLNIEYFKALHVPISEGFEIVPLMPKENGVYEEKLEFRLMDPYGKEPAGLMLEIGLTIVDHWWVCEFLSQKNGGQIPDGLYFSLPKKDAFGWTYEYQNLTRNNTSSPMARCLTTTTLILPRRKVEKQPMTLKKCFNLAEQTVTIDDEEEDEDEEDLFNFGYEDDYPPFQHYQSGKREPSKKLNGPASKKKKIEEAEIGKQSGKKTIPKNKKNNQTS